MKNCLIADDHVMMREALAGTVELCWPEADVALAGDFPSAWTAMLDRPDLCLCDLVMPGASPLDGITRLRAVASDVPILVVTGNEDDRLLVELFRLGVAGFVSKTSSSVVIEAAIRLILDGERYVPPRILDIVSQGEKATGPFLGETPKARLTPRQRAVLQLVAGGQTNKEIARLLDLSPATVKAHAAAAMAALGAANRTEAVVKGHILGVIDPLV